MRTGLSYGNVRSGRPTDGLAFYLTTPSIANEFISFKSIPNSLDIKIVPTVAIVNNVPMIANPKINGRRHGGTGPINGGGVNEACWVVRSVHTAKRSPRAVPSGTSIKEDTTVFLSSLVHFIWPAKVIVECLEPTIGLPFRKTGFIMSRWVGVFMTVPKVATRTALAGGSLCVVQLSAAEVILATTIKDAIVRNSKQNDIVVNANFCSTRPGSVSDQNIPEEFIIT